LLNKEHVLLRVETSCADLRREGTIPFPKSLMVTPAEDNDLTVFKQARGDNIFDTVIFGDKIYSDFEYFNDDKNKNRILKCILLSRQLRDNPNRKSSAKSL